MGLEEAYQRATQIIKANGLPAEKFEVAKEVERCRAAWRPPTVRVVLLAESHVWTEPHELKCRVEVNGARSAFTRFVYCLGYGEDSVVQGRITGNRGTRQYWRMFLDAALGPGKPDFPAGTRQAGERIERKIKLLRRMQEQGIWLVDASVTALYRNRSKLVKGPAYGELLRACWASAAGETVAGCAPAAVLIVGKMVSDALASTVRSDLGPKVSVDWVYQPNARLSSQKHSTRRQRAFDFCSSFCGPMHDWRRRESVSPARSGAAQASVAVRYSATRLTFKRDVIEKLGWDDAFEVSGSAGAWRFTKRQFYATFRNVLRSKSYQIGGMYNYQLAPQKAEPFRTERARS